MNELKIFENAEFGKIRIVEINDEPWFVGKDVAQALGYGEGKSLANAVANHVDEEDKGVTELMTPGGKQKMVIINESGLYSLVLSSKLPTARKFKRWVTAEVLPSIRKTGGYAIPKDYPSALRALADAEEQRFALEAENQQNKPKALFADAVCASKTSILVGELAKLLKQNGVDIGQNRLFAWMRGNGFLIRRQGTDFNMPTQKAMELGLFEIKETAITHSDGHTSVNKTPKVTGKGQLYFVKQFLSDS